MRSLSKHGDQGEGGSRAQRGGTPPATASASACHLFHAARSQPPTHIRDGGREQPVAQLLTEHSRRRTSTPVRCWLQTRGFVRAVNVSAFSADSVRLWTAQQAPRAQKASSTALLTVLELLRAHARAAPLSLYVNQVSEALTPWLHVVAPTSTRGGEATMSECAPIRGGYGCRFGASIRPSSPRRAIHPSYPYAADPYSADGSSIRRADAKIYRGFHAVCACPRADITSHAHL